MKSLLLGLLTAILLAGCSLEVQSTTIVMTVPVGTLPVSIGFPTPAPGQPTPGQPAIIPQFGVQTKTTGCQANGPLPDSACTPGAIFPDATVDQICTPGYSSSVRSVSTATKDQVYFSYGILTHTTGEYEVDHLISLELGGSNDISNLWPEAAEPRPGFHEKDAVENYLHSQVCSGAVPLLQAQQEIATNWLAVYQQMGGG
jgi:hypothetical protein